LANPYCLAMVLCDGVHRDPSTGKFTILGTFSSFASASYPAQINLCIYSAITDGLGPVTLRIQLIRAEAGIVDAQDESELPGRVFIVKRDMDFHSPFAVVESAIGMQTELPEPGQYHCELWANEELLMSRRLIAGEINHGENNS